MSYFVISFFFVEIGDIDHTTIKLLVILLLKSDEKGFVTTTALAIEIVMA